MASRDQDPASRHIDKVIAHIKKKAQSGEAALLEEFIRQYYGDIAVEDLLTHSPADLFGAAYGHWKFGQQRTAGKPSIRIFNPSARKDGWASTHTILEMVNDDMPFLVDSASMALNRHGVNLHLTVHPIIRVVRDEHGQITKVLKPGEFAASEITESYLHMEVDRQNAHEILEELYEDLEKSMQDVRAAVQDWQLMRDKLREVSNAINANPPPLDPDEISEGQRFLEWIANNHFTLLGYREYDLVRERGEDLLRIVPESGLGILHDTHPQKVSHSFLVLPKDVRARARAKELMIITKANSIATVHRPGYLDYIGIKRFDEHGEVCGEWRFLGLFTSSAYSRSPRDIPVLRKKVEEVMRRSGLPANSHDGKALLHILETFPRDELFQSTVDELFNTATGVVRLQERQRIKLFIRRDSFGRFFSCLVYVPRDRYNTTVRERIQDILHQALHGKHLESTVQLSESMLARVHIIVRTTPWQFPKFKLHDIEKQIEMAVRSWLDELHDAIVEKCGEERGLKLYTQYARYFPVSYQEDVTPRAAAFDIEQIDELTDDDSLRMSLYRPTRHPVNLLRFKLFRREQPIPISDALPMLENMGLKVISERPYEMELGDASLVWIQDFDMIFSGSDDLQLREVEKIFRDAFECVWNGRAENDSFNRLVLLVCLDWRQTALLRAYCKYLLQTGLPFSQAYMEQTLTANAKLAQLLVKYFEARLDPTIEDKAREALVKQYNAALDQALDSVSSLDEDRILRSFRRAVRATLRTNYFQKDKSGNHKPYISLKFDPSQLPDLPLPRPLFEVWVYSPRVEAVHLRGGKVARGGIRWSDRREDFRTEVLGLMKAQMVKNTVIVPVGSKGGFVVKRPPSNDNREALMNEVIECYRIFMRGMLDITDNIVKENIVPPPEVVRHDEDDPYLVVAADKGTATFSDIANGVAREYKFWLDDAFASGGSAGYDHKKMGITARGAWESVKRHFRELGTDIQTTDFTATGIGDMAGDVFGNGMLLSRHTCLKAAFNHMHIFLDPNPDAETSYRERERLFSLPRSSWADYNYELISKGGGVYPRSAKEIRISPEVRQALDINADRLPPQELIRAILKAPVDLLWNGGIGTYVKSSEESNGQAGDRANDALRVNGNELRCKVVGEGGNLGLTQRGRIEYALNGGRINTDFIDNSAGVDCSDHEVNIKILLNIVTAEKRFTEKKRNELLAAMTDEVGELVLRDNYMQTQAITIAEAQAQTRINEHAFLIKHLERTGALDRTLEFLPSDEELTERHSAHRGLTRPEIAVLLAYSKITIYNDLLHSDVPEDSYLARELECYFPLPLGKRYLDFMSRHRLRREIIATAVTNTMVNHMGPTFVLRMQGETGAEASAIARAYTIARESSDMGVTQAEIEALDNRVPASIQTALYRQSARFLRHLTRWLLNHPHQKLDIAATVSAYAPGISRLMEHIPEVLPEAHRDLYNSTIEQYTDIGIPQSLANRIAGFNPLYASMDIVDIAEQAQLPIENVASTYFHMGMSLEFDWLRNEIEELSVDGHWQAVARGTLREDLYAQQRALTAQIVLGAKPADDTSQLCAKWLENHGTRVQHALRLLADMKTTSSRDFATLSVALQEIRKLARSGTVQAA